MTKLQTYEQTAAELTKVYDQEAVYVTRQEIYAELVTPERAAVRS